MNIVLLKPHVENSQGHITTPDIIVDQLFVSDEHSIQQRPAGLLSHASWLDLHDTLNADILPCVLFVAAGAGTLICPAFAINDTTVSVARAAWRLDQVNGCAVESKCGSAAEPVQLIMPEKEPVFSKVPGASGSTLPRGTALLCSFPPSLRPKPGTHLAGA